MNSGAAQESPSIIDIAYAKWFLLGNRAFSPPIVEITPEAAAFLARYHTGHLNLSALVQLSSECATELSGHRGDLDLSGLLRMSAEVANSLAKHRGILLLDGLKDVTRETARRLAAHQGALHLGGLETPEDELIAELSCLAYPLWLPGIHHLTEVQSQHLARHGSHLNLDGLTELSQSVAIHFKNRNSSISFERLSNLEIEIPDYFSNISHLYLKGIKDISVELAVSLARFPGTLDLSGIVTISEETALALATHRNALHLDGLSQITSNVALALSSHNGDLTLDGVTALEQPQSEALAFHKGDLSLDGLRTIDPDEAAHLAKHVGNISLLGLQELSTESEAILGIRLFTQKDALAFVADPESVNLTQYTHLSSAGIMELRNSFASLESNPIKAKERLYNLMFSGVKGISQETAKLLVEASLYCSKHVKWSSEYPTYRIKANDGRSCMYLDLSGIQTLFSDICATLSEFSGDLDLSGLSSLSDDQARALCGDDGSYYSQPGILNLNGLNELSSLAASALSIWKGRILLLDGLKTLTPVAAKALRGFRGRIISLKGLTDVADIKPMKDFTGFVELPDMLPSLTTEQATVLADSSMVILNMGSSLNYKTHGNYLSETSKIEIADIIAEYKGILELSVDFAKVTPEVLRALAAYCGPQLVIERTILSPGPTESHLHALSNSQAQSLYLSGIELTPSQIRELAPYRGGLILDDISLSNTAQTMDCQYGDALATLRSCWLSLDIEDISEDAATAINNYAGWLILNEIRDLSAGKAYLLSSLKGKVLSIPELYVSQDVSDQLVKFKGYIDISGAHGEDPHLIIGNLKTHNNSYQKHWELANAKKSLFCQISHSKHSAYIFHRNRDLVPIKNISMNLQQYSELLCKVLTEMSAERPYTPWSLAELNLSEEESNAFTNLPQYFDGICDELIGQERLNVDMADWGNFTVFQIVGACLMICESIALRERTNANEYTQTLLGLNWSECTRSRLFVQQFQLNELNGPNENHNRLIRSAVSRLRLRSAIDINVNNRWEKTLLLQIGLSKAQWSALLRGNFPETPGQTSPAITRDLYPDTSIYHALSFKNTWDALRSFKQNEMERRDTENSLYDSPWIANEWIDDLLNVAENVPITDVVSIIQNAPKLRWNNAVPFFLIRLDQQRLRNRVPHEINEVDLMLNGKWKARLAYINNSWNRVTGGIDNNLEFRYDLDTQTSADIEVSVISAAIPTNTLTPQTIHLWQCDSLISRFGNDGLLHRNAWRKQVVMGEGITLIVPSGSTITPEPIARIPIDDGMSDICHIAPNWQGPVQVTQDNETWWDSDNLVVPDRSLNLDDKTFEISLLVDSGPNANGEIRGHLEWKPANHPISWIQIGIDKLDPDSARNANAIHIKCDWFQSKPVIVCKVNSGARSGRVEKRKYPSIRAYNSGILICHTESDGLIMDPRKIETAEQLRKTKFQYLKPETRPPLPPLQLFQFESPIISINNIVTRLNQVPFFARGLRFLDGSGREQIPGVVERGIISRVARISTNNEGTSFAVCLNRGIPPIHPPGHDGRHHRIVVFSRIGDDPRNRFKWTVIEGADNITQEGEANPEWTVKIAEDLGLILGVAVTFGASLLGYWVKEGKVDSFSQALSAANLTPDEATDLARMLRWFQAPLLAQPHRKQIARFFLHNAVPVMNAWMLESSIFIDDNQYQNNQEELCWHWVVSEIAQDAKRLNNDLYFNKLYNVNQRDPKLLLEQVRDIAFAWPPAAADFARAVMAQNPEFRWNYAEVFEVQQCIGIEPMDIGALRQRINWGIQLVANPHNLPDFNRDEQFKPDEVRNGLRRQSYCKLIAFKLLQPEAEL